MEEESLTPPQPLFTISNSTDISEELKESSSPPPPVSSPPLSSKVNKATKSPKPSKGRKPPQKKKVKFEPEEEEEEEEDFNLDFDDEDEGIRRRGRNEDDDEEEEEEDIPPPPPRRKAPQPKVSNPTEKDWKNFVSFVKQKKASRELTNELEERKEEFSESLAHLDENLEIIRRMGNIKFKPEEDLTLDDYLAWYAVDSGKVKLPKGALDLINPDSVTVRKQAMAQQIGDLYVKQKNQSLQPPSDPENSIIPGLLSLARWGW